MIFDHLVDKLASDSTMIVACLEAIEALALVNTLRSHPNLEVNLFRNPFALKSLSLMVATKKPHPLLESRIYHFLITCHKK